MKASGPNHQTTREFQKSATNAIWHITSTESISYYSKNQNPLIFLVFFFFFEKEKSFPRSNFLLACLLPEEGCRGRGQGCHSSFVDETERWTVRTESRDSSCSWPGAPSPCSPFPWPFPGTWSGPASNSQLGPWSNVDRLPEGL